MKVVRRILLCRRVATAVARRLPYVPNILLFALYSLADSLSLLLGRKVCWSHARSAHSECGLLLYCRECQSQTVREYTDLSDMKMKSTLLGTHHLSNLDSSCDVIRPTKRLSMFTVLTRAFPESSSHSIGIKAATYRPSGGHRILGSMSGFGQYLKRFQCENRENTDTASIHNRRNVEDPVHRGSMPYFCPPFLVAVIVSQLIDERK